MSVEYWGDSIAHGYRITAKGGGVTRVGARPAEILQNIKSKGRKYFSGKTIVLSTGYSNDPNNIKGVENVVKELRGYGANVVLLGVANTYNIAGKKGATMNQSLANIASKHGATFNGGFTSNGDNVHPKSYAKSTLKLSGASSNTKASTSSPKTTSSGGLWGNNYGISDFVPPVANAKITSGEGHRKSFTTDNGAKSSSFHKGVDVVGGKDISSITGGTVTFVGNVSGFGNTVVIKNPQGYVVQYAHLADSSVKVGQQVRAGERIATMGATGNSTGVHLDMIVSKDGKVINRQGEAFGNAGGAYARGGKGAVSAPTEPTAPTAPTAPNTPDVPTPTQTPLAPMQATPMPYTPMQSSVAPPTDGRGLLTNDIPDTPTTLSDGQSLFQSRNLFEQRLFNDIMNSDPQGEREGGNAMAARALSDAHEMLASKSLFPDSPFAPYVRQVMDQLNV